MKFNNWERKGNFNVLIIHEINCVKHVLCIESGKCMSYRLNYLYTNQHALFLNVNKGKQVFI